MRLSFSQWENYAQCPRRWKHGYIDKMPRTPAGPAAQRGSAIHDQIEQCIKEHRLGPVVNFPVSHHIDVIARFGNHKNGELHTEYKVAFDGKWNRTLPEASTVRFVGVFDAVLHRPGEVEIGEWKTGKPKDTHADQRRLYTLMAFRTWGVERVTATTYYFDNTSEPARLTAKASSVTKLIKIWDDRARQMEADTFWPPRPGFYCRWCDYAKSKGGPCPFS